MGQEQGKDPGIRSPFPARRRQFRCLDEDLPSLPELAPDPILDALRRLRAERIPTAPDRSATADQRQPSNLSGELHRLERSLHDLRERLDQAASPEESGGGDALAHILLQRAVSYYNEWRSLPGANRDPAIELADFAASTYLELLERHHPRLALVVDGEGRLLRLLHGTRVPVAAALAPAAGEALGLRPVGERMTATAWPGLPPLLAARMGVGWMMVMAETQPPV
ncbi:MAG: hypothetical protein Q8O14_05355 [bacterium]|jgi:hypothetical protein|nr:hypothetical protein [bacterium]